MDLTRHLGIGDHTKVNFHLKNLKSNQLVSQDREKFYYLTPQGEKMVDCLGLYSVKTNSLTDPDGLGPACELTLHRTTYVL